VKMVQAALVAAIAAVVQPASQAAEKLVEAGRHLAREPQAMQLRYFAALHDAASERSSTIAFPLPTDLLAHSSRPTTGGR